MEMLSDHEESRPGLLDIYNMEEVSKLLPKSFKYLLKILLSEYHSNKFLMQVYNRFEDINFGVNCLVNYFILHKTNSTFLGNNFSIGYEFKEDFIDKSDYIFFILCDTFGFDFLFYKLDSYKQSLVDEYKLIKKNYKMELIKDNGRFWEDNIDDFKQKLKKTIKLEKYNLMFKVYPAVKKYYKMLKFITKICYYKNLTSSYTPLQFLMNIKVVKSNNNTHLGSKIFVAILTAMRIIDYYNRENLLSTVFSKDKDLIDKVPLPKPALELDKCNFKKKKCPICYNNYTDPTCLEENGLVFCYDCIYNNLEHQRNKNSIKLICPVTKMTLRHGFNSLTRLRN
ncbi:hypothetical protein QEN19_002668 [Hanseniaspora menglaensis]